MSRRNQSGFNLVETVATLAIAATVTGLAVPALNFMFQRAQQSAVLTELASGLQTARTQAIRSGQPVSFCPSADGERCDRGPAPDWADGWILFSDTDADVRRSPGERLLYRYRHLHPSFTLVGSHGLEHGSGFLPGGEALRSGLLDYCAGGDEGRRLHLLESGQWRIEPLSTCRAVGDLTSVLPTPPPERKDATGLKE